MSIEPGSFTSNGSMIVVSNRLPFVLKRNELTGQLERKARLVTRFNDKEMYIYYLIIKNRYYLSYKDYV